MGKAGIGNGFLAVSTSGSDTAVVALAGSQDIHIPILFVSGGALKDAKEAFGEVSAVHEGEIFWATNELLHNFAVDRTFVWRCAIYMQVLVAVHPLVPRNVVSFLEESYNPALWTIGDIQGGEVAGDIWDPLDRG